MHMRTKICQDNYALYQEQKNELHSLKNQIIHKNAFLDKVNEEVNSMKFKFEDFMNQFEILKKNFYVSRDMLVDLNINSTRIQLFEKNCEENELKLLHIRNLIEDLQANQDSTDNYLEKYIPFRIQNFISENLEAIMNSTQKRKFQEFEFEKYRQMHAIIMKDDGEPKLDKHKEELIKLNKKSIKLQKKNVISESDLDSNPPVIKIKRPQTK